MKAKQKIVFLMPPALIAIMYPIFQLLSRNFGDSIGWFIGLIIYWILWGIVFSTKILGRNTIARLLRPQKIEFQAILLTAIPILFAIAGRFFFDINYEKPSMWISISLLITALGNGIFEEIIWRGNFLVLFPNSIFYQIIWPGLWFGLWHYAPGSVSDDGNILDLMISATFFGLFLGFLARQTKTLWYPIIAHTLSGIVMVI